MVLDQLPSSTNGDRNDALVDHLHLEAAARLPRTVIRSFLQPRDDLAALDIPLYYDRHLNAV
ncbi:MAG: hypothetical protein E6G95_06365 [Alphaproteobacteria bacterium]|nr:MAG: hypothetical protein E6G95_06365 [Alphaproteobacteria bacterium]